MAADVPSASGRPTWAMRADSDLLHYAGTGSSEFNSVITRIQIGKIRQPMTTS